jgi:hypothetical protein
MNPLMKAMSGTNPAIGGNNMFSNLVQIKNMLQGKNPSAVMQSMLNNNPQFGKSPEQIAKENGIDFEQIKSFFK